ncbi:mitochondrial protein C2orf69 homolog [Hypanus sabinus]|uniref:mitochondrial protein C2orf69 homolog n=1 Tax=Hypanus sabinus TaxID=79690 RepID=UPI0028C4A11B|nr:mitochondrial protein C2orf69 homolog [Hypanus sabinus]
MGKKRRSAMTRTLRSFSLPFTRKLGFCVLVFCWTGTRTQRPLLALRRPQSEAWSRRLRALGSSGRGPVVMSGPGRAAEAARIWKVPGIEVLRLSGVTGWGPGKKNDLVLGVGDDPRSGQHVVYFPGDVQNYHELMTRHSENLRWQRWSLEEVAVLLFHRFPRSHIWIIKASRIHLHKFSCYDNFVQSNLFGVPEHSFDRGAFKHLYSLLMNGFKQKHTLLHSRTSPSERACGSFAVEHGEGCSDLSKTSSSFSTKNDLSTPSLSGNYTEVEDLKCTDPSLKFILIGFSKGCVVLNQLLYALNEAQKDEELAAFISNIKGMYWLDGGHAGGSNTWVTDPEILKRFAKTGIPVFTHVTPYQVQDSMRAWIGKEHKKFIRLLGEYGAKVTNQLHFENENPSLDNHFRVLQAF